MFSNFNIVEFIIRIPALLLALSIHEFCHGFAAYRMGDSTAKHDGRLSLNPLRHFDPLGLCCMLLFRFGWAKPVMVDPRRFEYPKFGMAMTAFAGPLSNFLFAFVILLIFYPLRLFVPSSGAMPYVYMFMVECFSLNIGLGLFNLLPIPPLDGSKFFGALLPDPLYFRFIAGGTWSTVALMLLILTGASSNILSPVLNGVVHIFILIITKIYFFL